MHTIPSKHYLHLQGMLPNISETSPSQDLEHRIDWRVSEISSREIFCEFGPSNSCYAQTADVEAS